MFLSKNLKNGLKSSKRKNKLFIVLYFHNDKSHNRIFVYVLNDVLRNGLIFNKRIYIIIFYTGHCLIYI